MKFPSLLLAKLEIQNHVNYTSSLIPVLPQNTHKDDKYSSEPFVNERVVQTCLSDNRMYRVCVYENYLY